MGFSLGCLGPSIACFFGNAYCSFCCASCPSCKGSTSTRLAYIFILLSGLLTSFILLIPGLDKALSKMPYLCKISNLTNSSSTSTIDCSNIVGYLAVYRLLFGIVIFFLILSLLMIKVKTSNNHRAKIQNGFWGFKLIILIGITTGTFYIPHSDFDLALTIIGFIGGFLFILVQLLLSINFVHSWNESWVDHVETGSKRHGYGLLFSTFLFYILTIIGNVLFYKYYVSSGHRCPLNTFLISFNICLCVLLSIISISPCVRAYNSSCGLLQSSFISLYVTYYIWSAMSSHPCIACHPSKSGHSVLNPITIIGLLLFIWSIIYSVFLSSRKNRTRKLFFPSTSVDSGILDDAQLINSTSDNKWILGSHHDNYQIVYDDERGAVKYNYTLFHLMLLAATLYVMMTLTNWGDPTDDYSIYKSRYASLWVKVVASWMCVGLYIWSCVAPAIFPEKDFT